MKYLAVLPALAIVLTACGSSTESPARDPKDTAYLAALDAAGVPHADNDAAIRDGKAVCATITKNRETPTEVASGISIPALNAKQSAALASAAIDAYCPQPKS
ncbi:DUF732 domain-containing protein [Nocardia sp. NPDC052566]|uniref:DUF732 domain-containing protein n=1 Tax=Nocardia sp. NPDC052566 TaxID=3364330 RepID=UPI0037CAF7C9